VFSKFNVYNKKEMYLFLRILNDLNEMLGYSFNRESHLNFVKFLTLQKPADTPSDTSGQIVLTNVDAVEPVE
jgi:hypothetical protein